MPPAPEREVDHGEVHGGEAREDQGKGNAPHLVAGGEGHKELGEGGEEEGGQHGRDDRRAARGDDGARPRGQALGQHGEAQLLPLGARQHARERGEDEHEVSLREVGRQELDAEGERDKLEGDR
jgi:hypothetical protein